MATLTSLSSTRVLDIHMVARRRNVSVVAFIEKQFYCSILRATNVHVIIHLFLHITELTIWTHGVTVYTRIGLMPVEGLVEIVRIIRYHQHNSSIRHSHLPLSLAWYVIPHLQVTCA